MEISIKALTDGINAKSHRKENNFYKSYTIVSFENNQWGEPISVRFYATAATTFCCIWGNIKGEHFNGSGKAGGYGYERSSAAFEYALESAGFNVKGLACTGQNEEAIHIIAKQLMDLTNYTIVYAHP